MENENQKQLSEEEVDSFSVISEMTKLPDGEVWVSVELLTAKRVKRGGEINFGIDATSINRLMRSMFSEHPKYFAMVVIANREQYDEIVKQRQA
jgi:hypothetical protein